MARCVSQKATVWCERETEESITDHSTAHLLTSWR